MIYADAMALAFRAEHPRPAITSRMPLLTLEQVQAADPAYLRFIPKHGCLAIRTPLLSGYACQP